MKIIEPAVELLWVTPNALQVIERAGRVCYKSEDKITEESAETFVKSIIDRGHEAVLEHASASLLFICDRGVTHEIVRHRLASYCQESTRYCNYSKAKFGGITFIDPCFWSKDDYKFVVWKKSMQDAENTYLCLLGQGATPQEARSVLPNSLKTEIVVTANFREWRHILKLRTAPTAHPQMREVMGIAKGILIAKFPEVFVA